MGTVRASAERLVDAPADVVYGCIADMRDHHPHFLPPAFSGFQVESGGVGAGTVVRFTVTAGGRQREYRMEVSEPEPGRMLTESDTNSSLVTTFVVEPRGDASSVRVTTTWTGAGGIGGFFERRFAPNAMERIYADELDRLDAHVRQHAGDGTGR
ncbi:MAG: SRPBCC family protein [Acidimicrobiales bacterium]